MNNSQKDKLERVLAKRIQKLESVNFFSQYFEEFAYTILKKAVYLVNSRLESITSENLRIFTENPYINKRSRYFVMVQLFSRGHQRNTFLLDNTQAFPSLVFEGDEFTGTVHSVIQFENKINTSTQHNIAKLRDEDYVTGIVIDFLDQIYSL